MQKHEKYGGRVSERADQACCWPTCADAGEFRAPKNAADTRNRTRFQETDSEGLWFCLDHVREYNARWDCFAGLSTAEIDKFRRSDSTWHRPTWPFTGPAFMDKTDFDARPIDPLNIFDNEHIWSHKRSADGFTRPLNGKDRRALSVMGLDHTVGPTDIKTRFKALVKELHPDRNGGDRSNEDRLRDVIDAYNHLSEAFVA